MAANIHPSIINLLIQTGSGEGMKAGCTLDNLVANKLIKIIQQEVVYFSNTRVNSDNVAKQSMYVKLHVLWNGRQCSLTG